MQLQIIDSRLILKLSGLSKTHDPAKSYGDELIELLDVVWENVKSSGVLTTGINHAVYGEQGEIFAGVEITTPGAALNGLAAREIVLERYAYYKHVGPYAALADAHAQMAAEIRARSLVQSSPVIEIYGHWNEDPAKLETEIIYAVR
jgi:hypothetical protein